jgi:hypothetical protein
MSFDLSWLWNTLNGIISTIQSWFGSLWTVAQNITNTGQGIFSGLIAFGSQLWDAITKAFDTIGEWFYNAFNWIWQGLIGLGQTLGGWISTALQWLSSGIQWVANGIWSLGSWIYNGLIFIWNWIVNTAQAVWGAIVNFFSGIANAIGSWWGSVVNGINTWFTNLIVGIRNKIVDTIMADVSIYFGWKSIERLTNTSSLKDAGFSILGLVGAPLVGYLFGSIVNGLIPTPSTTPMQLIPEITPFSYSPPSLMISTPTERIPPTQIPYTPSTPPVYGYTPVTNVSLSLDKPTYESRWDIGTGITLSIDAPTYEVGVS